MNNQYGYKMLKKGQGMVNKCQEMANRYPGNIKWRRGNQGTVRGGEEMVYEQIVDG